MPSRKATAFSPYHPRKRLTAAERRRTLASHYESTKHPPGSNSNDEYTELSKALDGHDLKIVQGCQEDIDTLLVFAGLFSAAVTAMNVEGYKTLTEDPGDFSAAVLVHISQQLADMSPGLKTINATQGAYGVSHFQPRKSAVRINILWFASLVFSLVAASLCILVKQWLREYMAGRRGPAEECVRIRQYRYEGLLKWRVFDIVAVLPLLLHISLVLFFVGLSDFLVELDTTVGVVVSILIGTWLALYFTSLIAPAVFSDCPYVTPLMKPAIGPVRRTVWHLWCYCQSWFDDTPIRLHKYYGYPGDEMGVRRNARFDQPAIICAADTIRDDAFLDDVIRPCLRQLDGPDVHAFIKHFLRMRLHGSVSLPATPIDIEGTIDFARMSTRAVITSVNILCSALEKTSSVPASIMEPWAQESLAYVYSAAEHCSLNGRVVDPITWGGVASLATGLIRSSARPIRMMFLLCASRYSTLLDFVKYSEIGAADLTEIVKSAELLVNTTPLWFEYLVEQANSSTTSLDIRDIALLSLRVNPLDFCASFLRFMHNWASAHYVAAPSRFTRDSAWNLPANLFSSMLTHLSATLWKAFWMHAPGFEHSKVLYSLQLSQLLAGIMPVFDDTKWTMLRRTLSKITAQLNPTPPDSEFPTGSPAHHLSFEPTILSASPTSLTAPMGSFFPATSPVIHVQPPPDSTVQAATEPPAIRFPSAPPAMRPASPVHHDLSATSAVPNSPYIPSVQLAADDHTPAVDSGVALSYPPRSPSPTTSMRNHPLPVPNLVELIQVANPAAVSAEDGTSPSEDPLALAAIGVPITLWRECVMDLRTSWEQLNYSGFDDGVVNKWNALFVPCGAQILAFRNEDVAAQRGNGDQGWVICLLPLADDPNLDWGVMIPAF